MRTAEIVDFVNNHVTYRKGWDIFAIPAWTGLESSGSASAVEVYCEFAADNSSPRNIDRRERVLASGSFTVPEGTRDEVEAALLAGFLGIEAHECREFLRIDGEAPFHPHRPDGDHAYEVAGHTHNLPITY